MAVKLRPILIGIWTWIKKKQVFCLQLASAVDHPATEGTDDVMWEDLVIDTRMVQNNGKNFTCTI